MARRDIRILHVVPCFAIALLLSLVCHNVASACNVPVFRYALERWRQDSYRVTVLHRGELDEAARKLVGLLQTQQDESVANLDFRLVDVDKLDAAADKELFSALGDVPLPRLIVQYPAKFGVDAPLWSAPLSAEGVARLTDSPLRKELVRRLVSGQTAVWLVLESGDEGKDNAAAALVEQQLRKLEKELKLPELTEDPADRLAAGPPLVVAFSLLRVSRSEAEGPLVQMLLRCEPDLAERADPLVFPVFGRGRALLPLVGAGITHDNIHHSAAFLVAACSCEVKDQNPGFDLLLSADWYELLSPSGQPTLPADVAQPTASDAPVLVPIPSGSQPSVPVVVATTTSFALPDFGISPRFLALGGGIFVILLLGVATLVVAFSRRDPAVPRQDG